MRKTIIYVVAIVVMMFASVTVCYADEINIPNIDTSRDYIVFQQTAGTQTLYYAVEYDYTTLRPINAYDDNINKTRNHLYLEKQDGVSSGIFTMYAYNKETNAWQVYAEFKDKQVTVSQDISGDIEYIYSSQDIKDTYGEMVFPPPRPVLETILERTEQTIPVRVGGVMKTLTLCGVGCLALLMALGLFGKVLHRFQVK